MQLTAPVTGRSRRWTLPDRAAYGVAASVIGLGLFASVTPSPLYHSYSVLWHFSPLTLTLIYATYALGVLASLLVAGRISDDVGRRPVLLASLAILMASSVLYVFADSAAWLFAARGVQGLATGAALSAASAALLDLHPRRDPAGVGLTNATASVTGLGLGILVSSSLVQLGSAPRVLPYVVLLVMFSLAATGAFLMREPVSERRPFRLTIERPSVPAAVRRPFLLAALAVLSSWSIGALFFSLGPQLSAELFGTNNVIADGSGIVLLTAAAGIAQVLTVRTPAWIAAGAGSIALAAGMGLIVARRRRRLRHRLSGRLASRRSRLRRRLPRRPPGPGHRDPAHPSRLGHVGLLHRRVRLAVGPGRPRRRRRRPRRPRHHLRDLRQRRCGDRPPRCLPGAAHASDRRADDQHRTGLKRARAPDVSHVDEFLALRRAADEVP